MAASAPARAAAYRRRKSPASTALRRRQDRRAPVPTARRTGFTALHVGHHARQGPHRGPTRSPRSPRSTSPSPRGYRFKSKVLGQPLDNDQLGPRAPRQADRPGRVRLRRAVVHRLRQRGDPPDAPARRRCRRPPGLQPAGADHAGPGRGAGHPDLQLPPDHQGLPVGRRRLHRHQGQPRPAARPGRRRRPAHRLHPHRVGVGLRRRRRALLARSPRSTPTGCRSPSAFIAIICVGNLRGVKESGKIFAVPTYLFIIAMFLMIITGVVKAVFGGGLEHVRSPRSPVALEATGAVDDPPRPPRLRLRRRGHDRRRGHLQRRARLQAGRVEARPRDPHDHGRAARLDVPRHLVARRQAPVGAQRVGRRSSPRSPRRSTAAAPIGHAAVPLHPGRHHADPGARGQHELRRLPPAGQLPRRRRVHAQAAHQARPPAGVLQRHHRPGRRRRRSR